MYRSTLAGALLLACCGIALAAPGTAEIVRAEQQQDALVRAWPAGESIAGYKSAFASAAMQQRFGLSAPAMAVLPSSGQRCAEQAAPCVIDFAGYREPAIEIEVALRLASDIESAPATALELLPYIEAAMPALELPDLGLGDGATQASGVDYIATNIGTRAYVLGAPRLPILLLQRNLELRLRRGSELLLQGIGDTALDAALVLVRDALARGYALRAGHILLSGAVGGITPGRPGDYVAECGSLGTIEFTVR